MAYVYGHYKADTGELFYIGKGSGNRAWSIRNRNKHWHSVVNKHGFTVSILEDELSENEAYDTERMLIAEVGVHNLVNKTEGGDGLTSESLKRLYQEHPETKIKISNSLKGKPKTKEHAKRISEGKKGKVTRVGAHSEETKRKIAEGRKRWFEQGNVAWNKDKKGVQFCSEETKKKLSEIVKNQTRGPNGIFIKS